jgi:hypothetical protein
MKLRNYHLITFKIYFNEMQTFKLFIVNYYCYGYMWN